jgi:hypothetical protein
MFATVATVISKLTASENTTRSSSEVEESRATDSGEEDIRV